MVERGASPVIARAVAIGGGHGQARTLTALRAVGDRVTAIATVADDGGSSGRLRRDLGVIPPGDLRMAVAALAEDATYRALLDHRFDAGELAGHSLGNLLMVGLAEVEGGMVEALRRMTADAGTRHEVLPSTLADVHLAGVGPDGHVVGQAAVAMTPGVTELRLVGDEAVAHPRTVAALRAADLVVLGPGSVVTSVLPNLLVAGIGEALLQAQGPIVLVGNLDEQEGEGEGRSLADHVRLLRAAVPRLRVDCLIAHDGPDPATGRPPLRADDDVRALVGGVVTADLLSRGPTGGHDADALAAVLRGVAG